jgi:hypothetical protein
LKESPPTAQGGYNERIAPEVKISVTVSRTLIAVGSSGTAKLPASSSSQFTSASSPVSTQPLATSQATPASISHSQFDGLASGILDKKGGILRGWRQYFCVVKNGELSYYEKEADAAAGKPPRKFYLLQDSVIRHAPQPGRQHAFEVVMFPATAKEKVLLFSATAAAFEQWFAAFSTGAKAISSGGHVVARISEFVEISPVRDDDDQTSIILTPLTIDIGITSASVVSVKCVLELDVVATHHVGSRIQRTTLFHMSPSHIVIGISPPQHFLFSVTSPAINVFPHIPLLCSFIAITAPPIFFGNLLQLPHSKLLKLLEPPPQIRNPLLSTDIEFKANLQHIAIHMPLAPPNSSATDCVIIHMDLVAAMTSTTTLPSSLEPSSSRKLDASVDVRIPRLVRITSARCFQYAETCDTFQVSNILVAATRSSTKNLLEKVAQAVML